MFPSTKRFLNKVHDIFDEFGYNPDGFPFDLKEFGKYAIKVINHTKDFEDGNEAIKMFKFIVDNYEKISLKVNWHLTYWESLPFNGNELLSIVSDDEVCGTYFVTNAFTSTFDEVYVSGYSFGEDKIITVKHQKGKFYLDYNGDPLYYLRFSNLSNKKMVLQDKDDNKLCSIALTDNLDISLNNNKTDYEIVSYESGMVIYAKDYINSLEEDEPDTEKALAFLSWDIIEKNSKFGFTRLENYDSDNDIDILILLAMSCFLTYEKYIEEIGKSRTATRSLAVSNTLRRIR